MEKTFKIDGKKIKYKSVRRDVKYPRLEYRTGKLVLILPKSSDNEKDILDRHKRWIYRKDKEIKEALEDVDGRELNMNFDRNELRELVKKNVKIFSDKLKVNVKKIILRKMRTKWASLSSRYNVTINTYTKFLPQELIKYIVFHEIAHLLVRKHNEKFWGLIEKQYSDYEKYEDELFKYWFLLQRKIKS